MAQMTLHKFFLLAATTSLIVTGCTKPPSSKEEQLMSDLVQRKQILPATREEREAIKNFDPIAQAKFWGDQFELNPGDHEAALSFANALRAIGSSARAIDVATQALALHPGDVELSKTLARAHMDDGHPDRAITALYNARPENEDWTLYSLYGVAMDQVGAHDKAQQRYVQALKISPDNQIVLANYALSLALQGHPEEAEKKLRLAIETNEVVDPRVRQNLALVLGIQGKFDEAEKVSAEDLAPAMVKANQEYYRKLLTPPSRSWNALRRTQDD